MSYLVKEVVTLPVHEDREIHPGVTVALATGEAKRKEPGETITKAEMKEHGQSNDDIAKLIADGAIEEQ